MGDRQALHMLSILLLACVVSKSVATVSATEPEMVNRLEPVDGAIKDLSFREFRGRLLLAVERHDAEALLETLAPDVLVSFGGEAGPDAFVRSWWPSSPDSGVWAVLGQVLSLGGNFNSTGEFCAPYVFSDFPDSLDAFEWQAALGPDVPVY